MWQLAVHMRPGSGVELLDLLEMRGSPRHNLPTGRDLIATDPNATAEQVYDALKAAGTAGESTLKLAERLLGELGKPMTLKRLADRLTNLVISGPTSPFQKHFNKFINPIPEWAFIKRACAELYGDTDSDNLEIARKKWAREIERLVSKLRFEMKLDNAGDMPLAEVEVGIWALLGITAVFRNGNPLEQMANILGELTRLAAGKLRSQAAKNATLVPALGDRLQHHSQIWESSKELARKRSVEREIPFAAFDPLLNEASQAWRTLLQISAGNLDEPQIHLPVFFQTENRLRELALTFAGTEINTAEFAALVLRLIDCVKSCIQFDDDHFNQPEHLTCREDQLQFARIEQERATIHDEICTLGNSLANRLAQLGENPDLVIEAIDCASENDSKATEAKGRWTDTERKLRSLARMVYTGTLSAVAEKESDRYDLAPAPELQGKADEMAAKYTTLGLRLLDLQPPFSGDDRTEILRMWFEFPLLKYKLYNGPHDFANQTLSIATALDYAHLAAVGCLARLAEFHAIWSIPIQQSGEVCNRLNWRNPEISNLYSSPDWPDCLGEYYHKLPGYQQKAIDDGEVAFLGLMKMDMQPQAKIDDRGGPLVTVRYMFKHDGNVWRLQFENEETTVNDTKGVLYIAKLLSKPNQEIESLVLEGKGGMSTRQVGERFGDDLQFQSQSDDDECDQEKVKEYRSHYKVLSQRIEQASGDARKELEEELAKFVHAADEFEGISERILNGEQGHRSRYARSLSTGNEQVKSSDRVKKAIQAAKQNIAKMPKLLKHLKSIRQSGTAWIYTCDDAPAWQINRYC